MIKPYFLALILCALLLVGCAPFSGTPATPEFTATATATLPAPVRVTPTAPRSTTLRIWLPPQFDPQNESPASQRLNARLEEFTNRREDVRIEVRIKAEGGAGGLVDSLSAASAAAPLILPDLIALPRSDLEIAALKGLLTPYDGLTAALEEEDWYPYAQELGHLQTSTYGLPFAGDALVLLHRPAEIPEPPPDWASALEASGILAFPAADPSALFTLAMYLAAGGNLQDAQGRPALDAGTLTQVLVFYQSAEAAGLMPFWITQYTSDEQSFEAYAENRANLVVTWISRYLAALPADSVAVQLPTHDGAPFTLADGWVWALSNPNVERLALSVELAEFLTAGDYLAEWTALAGYLPPRSSALSGWREANLQNLAEQIARSTHVIPPADVLAAVSPALHQATVDVLKEQADPASAAESAVERLARPQ